MRTAGFVLAGGQSTRMGRDKARLPVGNHLLVEEVAAQVRGVAGNVCLVGAAQRYADVGFDCVDDVRPGLGPLAGIETALSLARGEVNLIVACDMPGLRAVWLQQLLARANESKAPCIVTKDSSGQMHPLCGIWRSACLTVVRAALDEQHLRLLDVVDELGAETVLTDGPLFNVNTPPEWTSWLNEESRKAG